MRRQRTGSSCRSGSISGETTVTTAPHSSRPFAFSSPTVPPPTTRHRRPVEVEARHVVALLAHAQTPTLARRAPCRSRWTPTSAPPAWIVSENAPGPTARELDRLELAPGERAQRLVHRLDGRGGLGPVREAAGTAAAPPARRPARRARGSARSGARARGCARASRSPRRPSPRRSPPTSSSQPSRPATARTACASASATSRASPATATLTAASSPRIACSSCSSPPVSTAQWMPHSFGAFASHHQRPSRPASPGRDRARARRAADRGVAAVVERVVRDVALAHVVPDLFLRPLGERVELDDRAVVVVDLDLADVGARRPLVAAQAGDPRVERGQVPRQRLHLADVAAEQALLDLPVEEVRAVQRDHRLHLARLR